MLIKRITIFAVLLTIAFTGYGQIPPVAYPRVTGYVGLLHPIVTINKNETVANFDGFYLVGLPTGINIWKSDHIGFSAEFVPFVRSQDSISRMSNFLFHPGVLVRLSKNWVFAGRAAFETSGRFGFTPVINYTVIRGKSSSLFAALPLPVRFGNNLPTSFSPGFQFGIAF